MKRSLLLTLSLAVFASTAAQAEEQMFKIGTNVGSRFEDAMAVEAPRPEIPSELHEQSFKSSCVARFVIKDDGKSAVKIVSSSGNEEVDDIALDTLRRWRFKPALLDGKPVESTRKIRVEFEVE